MMGEKNYQKMSNSKYKKVLNKNDPVNQLIIELAEKGVLDVSFVEIRQESSVPETHEYSQKPVLYYLKKNHRFKRVKM